MSVLSEKLIPVRFNNHSNIITCYRVKIREQLEEISKQVFENVKNSTKKQDLVKNELYGSCREGKWLRAMIKFIRTDGIPVLQTVDGLGLIDFKPNKYDARVITDPFLHNLPFGQIKLVIYAIGLYEPDEEFDIIFGQTVLKQSVTGVYALLEVKDNQIKECFAGDLIYNNHANQLTSLRETLIEQRITYPSRSKSQINQRILRARTSIMMQHNIAHTLSIFEPMSSIFASNTFQSPRMNASMVPPNTSLLPNTSHGVTTTEIQADNVAASTLSTALVKYGYQIESELEILGEGSVCICCFLMCAFFAITRSSMIIVFDVVSNSYYFVFS